MRIDLAAADQAISETRKSLEASGFSVACADTGGVLTISLQPRQSGGNTASSTARPAPETIPRTPLGIMRRIGAGKCAHRMALPYPPPCFFPT